MTITLKDEVTLEQLISKISEQKCPYLEKITFLDLYKSDQIGKDKKNVTLRFVYRDREKTIALETVEKEHATITEQVTKAFKC